ncbi:MAG: C40 family peptidase [Chitinophagaceae bacterium]|nr:C40 family peptidase [Chitinophagaceae bacterium]
MKRVGYFILIGVMLTSCKTVRNITSKDNSSNNMQKDRSNRSIVFIDGIEITPGTIVKSTHKPATTKSKSLNYEVPNHLNSLTNYDIEKASSLQFKYALILDTYVEALNNIKLYLNIDEWWGTSYCLGGNSKTCIDCSAFTSTIIRDIYQINLPRTAAEQFNASLRIEKDSLQEGDLVFFKTKKNYINHVGIFLANDKFVHASTSQGVMISDLREAYWNDKFAGCGRVIN